MNSSRYILARIALSFGLTRKVKRLSEAADEMHLLCQAQEILGEDTWEQVEEVEAVHVDYWSLRKHQLAIDKLKKKIEVADAVLEASQEERNALLNQNNDVCEALEEERDDLIKQSEKIIAQRDEIIACAQQIKRRFEASQTKIEVLTTQDKDGHTEDNSSLIEEERMKVVGYKKDFVRLKKERKAIGNKIREFDVKIESVENKIAQDRKRLRSEASDAYQSIGQANRDKSKLSAEVGTIEDKKKQHFAEIGRYISTHVGSDPICTKICNDHSHLVAQIQNLRTSIALNQKLAAMAGHH